METIKINGYKCECNISLNKKEVNYISEQISDDLKSFSDDAWNWHGQDGAGIRGGEPYPTHIEKISECKFQIYYTFPEETAWNDNRNNNETWEKGIVNDVYIIFEIVEGIRYSIEMVWL